MLDKTVRSPHAALANQFLSDIAPELALRWATLPLDNPNRTVPPYLTRSLFSYLLRAATPSDADAAYKVLHALQTHTQETPGGSLGFTVEHSPNFVASILNDLLYSAAHNEPLLVNGPALTFYSDAGPGSGDADEYHSVTPDHRVQHCRSYEALSDIRLENLALAVRVFSKALCNEGARTVLTKAALSNTRYWAPLTDMLPDSIGTLPVVLREAVQEFYGVYMKDAGPHVRDSIRTKLVVSAMRLAHIDVCSLSVYIFGLTDVKMRMDVCRMCLVQRYKVRDCRGPLQLDALVDQFLVLRPVEGRVNEAVPAFLTGMMMAWYQVASVEDFSFKKLPSINIPESSDVYVVEILKKLKSSRSRITGLFGAPARDIVAFKVAVLAIANRIMEYNV